MKNCEQKTSILKIANDCKKGFLLLVLLGYEHALEPVYF